MTVRLAGVVDLTYTTPAGGPSALVDLSDDELPAEGARPAEGDGEAPAEELPAEPAPSAPPGPPAGQQGGAGPGNDSPGATSGSLATALSDWQLLGDLDVPQTSHPEDLSFPTPGSRSGDALPGDDDLPDFSPAAEP